MCTGRFSKQLLFWKIDVHHLWRHFTCVRRPFSLDIEQPVVTGKFFDRNTSHPQVWTELQGFPLDGVCLLVHNLQPISNHQRSFDVRSPGIVDCILGPIKYQYSSDDVRYIVSIRKCSLQKQLHSSNSNTLYLAVRPPKLV